jgi:hypothetical protein
MSVSIEHCSNKNYLMLCELHYPPIHGKTDDSDPHIESHYLVYDRFDPKTGISYSSLEEDYNTDNENDTDDENDNPNHVNKLNDVLHFLKNHYSNPINFEQNYYGNHPTIRNYHNIINNPNYIKPEIGQYIILPTQEAVAILNTFWLRIVQRKWKQIFAERQQIVKERKCPSSLYIRQVTGKWPESCRYLPSLKGMLSDLQ